MTAFAITVLVLTTFIAIVAMRDIKRQRKGRINVLESDRVIDVMRRRK